MKTQQGNILFLILIAVALFAALSYAITRSSSGGGNADAEQLKLSTAQWLNYVISARTAAQRMIISGTAKTNIELCSNPSGFCGHGVGFDDLCSTGSNCLFAPDGGGLTKPTPIAGKTVYFVTPTNLTIIDGVGTTSAEGLILYGDALTEKECQEINRGLGISTTILVETDNDTTVGEGLAISGKWDFCYDSNFTATANYLSHHVLYEQ